MGKVYTTVVRPGILFDYKRQDAELEVAELKMSRLSLEVMMIGLKKSTSEEKPWLVVLDRLD